ncbi:MAG: divalent-cation tolerance protein CutA [Candidatus Aenigmarchaeota archaeon]|nr:divalent-cation tolerance protein CutA [Candidatus Aenigmarchaeota archaeon]
MIEVQFACRDEKEAERISEALVKERLAACCNILKAKSVYIWKDRLCREKECIVFAKTSEKKAKQCEARIKELHSYELPAILFVPAKASKEYEKWVKDSVK